MIKEGSIVHQKKQSAKRDVLYIIYGEQQSTIPRLTQQTNISIPSLTEIIDELVNKKWIESKGVDFDSKSGRKAKLFSMKKDNHYILVYEIDIYFVRIVLLNFCNEIIEDVRKDILLKNDLKTIDYLIEEGDKILERHSVKNNLLAGIGISLPGLVNPYEKISFSYLNFTGNPLPGKMAEHFAAPVVIDNDLKAMTHGEHRFGKLKGLDHALVVNIDYGVGLGMILNGEVYHGASGFSGELGHIPVKNDGELCYCGKRGCLETIVSAQRLIERARELFSRGDKILKDIVKDDVNKISVESIIDASEAGDEAAIDLLSETGYELGRGLATVVHLLNPKQIIISGSIANAGKFILHPIEEALNKYCIGRIRNDVAVEITDLGKNSKIMGMYSMVAEKILNEINF